MGRKTPRNAKYLDYIRGQDCCACGREAPSQAAHVRVGGDGGMGLKPSDYFTLPLCLICHGKQHGCGERTFWSRVGKDPDSLIAFYMIGFIQDRKRAKGALEVIIESERA